MRVKSKSDNHACPLSRLELYLDSFTAIRGACGRAFIYAQRTAAATMGR